MLVELTSQAVLKNSATGQRLVFHPGQEVNLPSQIANKIIKKGKGHEVEAKPLQVPDACWTCKEMKCHLCPHGCKIGLIIGKQYTADHVFH